MVYAGERGVRRGSIRQLLALAAGVMLLIGSGARVDAAIASGSVTATLHPSGHVRVGDTVRVSFGLPLGEGALEDPSRIRLLEPGGEEIPVAVQPLVRWTDARAGVALKSWRSVLVQFDWKIADAKGQQVRVEWGGAGRLRNLNGARSPDKDWVLVDDREYPAAARVREPAVYVTLPAEYLARAGIFPDTVPFGGNGRQRDFDFIDDAQVKFYATAVNDVGPGINESEKIHYLTDNEPWLYDRASVFFRTYVRSGRLEHLKSAHRAAVYYVSHLDSDGFFELKKERDPKYSYGESLFADLMLFGDVSLLRKIEDVARATERVRLHYTNPGQFWTERHVAYRVLNAVIAFEASGKKAYISRAKEDIASLIELQRNPPSFIPARLRGEGCFVHTALSHGEGNEDEYACSPWMSVLIANAFQRYDRRGDDRQIAESVMRLADFVLGTGSRIEPKWIDGPRPPRPRIPYYLATSDKVLEGDPWADKEHALDVSKITALAYFYARRLSDPRAETYRRGTLELISSARANLEQWIRPDGPKYGKPVYRLAPSRKFGWWFNPYHDVAFLVAAE